MKSFEMTIEDAVGIHARPAGLLVQLAQRFESESTVTVKDSGKSASLKRLFALMGLGIKTGDRVTVSVNGTDEEEATAQLQEWMQQHLG